MVYMSRVETLRKEIENVDVKIVELLAKRFELTQETGRAKSELKMPMYDTEREAYLEKLWSDAAMENGLDSRIALGLLQAILSSSKNLQARKASGKKAIIVGSGSMAEGLGRIMKNAGAEVYLTARRSERSAALATSIRANVLGKEGIEADCIVFCVPPEALNNETIKLVQNCKARVAMDITSSKSQSLKVAEELSKGLGCGFVSTHPLFGLEDARPGEKIVIIKDKASKEDIETAEGFWSSCGLETVVLSVEQHERAMAISQVLRHLFALSLVDSCESLSKSIGVDYRNVATAKFSQLLGNAMAIKSEEWVALEIARANPYTKTVYETAIDSVQKRISMVLK